MRQYHRLMRRSCAMTYSPEERQELFVMLDSAPGITQIEIHDVHPKGGYDVTFEIAPDAIDALISSLVSHEWMSVV